MILLLLTVTRTSWGFFILLPAVILGLGGSLVLIISGLRGVLPRR